MTKPHFNKGKKHALKSGRTATLSTQRCTPQVREYMLSGKTTPADKIEAWAMAEINKQGESHESK